MRVLALTVLMMGCGGDSDTAGDTDTTDAGTNPADPCSGIPTYDESGMSCGQLANAYEEILEASDVCTEKADCVSIRAPCESWPEVGCWYVANKCADPRIGDIESEASGCDQPNAVCECGDAPALDCVAGKCQFVYNY